MLSLRLQITTLHAQLSAQIAHGTPAITQVIELLELFLPLLESLGGRYETFWVPRLGDLYYVLLDECYSETSDAEVQQEDDRESRKTSADAGKILEE
jgi:hypothetical protein